MPGISLLSTAQNTYSGFFFVTLKEWSQRKRPEEHAEAIMAHLNREMQKLPEAVAFAFPPPAIQGIGMAGGATVVLEDRSGKSIGFLAENLNKFVDAVRRRPEIDRATTTFVPGVPQLWVDVDRDKVLRQGVDVGQVYQTLQAFMGGYFINYFNRFGRQWQVYVQAEGEYRTKAEDVGRFYVMNDRGNPVPLSAVTTVRSRPGPEFTMRYNLYRAAQINVAGKDGYSSGQVMNAVEEVFHQTMPTEMGIDYIGMSFQEKKAREGVPASAIFGLSLLCVFLILAAQYESWSLPFSVLLCTPVAVFGAFAAIALARPRQQHLRPDRPHRPHRPGREKRDPYRRVRKDGARAGQYARSRRPRRGEAPAPADPHDVLRLPSRRPSPRLSVRGGGDSAPGHGDRRNGRDGGRLGHRRFPHPRHLLRCRADNGPLEEA